MEDEEELTSSISLIMALVLADLLMNMRIVSLGGH